MSKFLKLVRNEWRKQTLKKSFWVLLSLVVVIAAGWSVLNVLLTTSTFETETYYGTDFEGFAKEQIAWAEQFVNEVDGDGELTEYALNYRAEADAFRYLVEMDSDFDDWLYTLNVAHEMFYARHCGNEALYQRLRTVCDNRDIKGYYEYYRDIQTDANPQYAAQYREITDWCIQNEVEPSGSDWRYSLAFQALDSAVAVAKQKQLQADGSSAFSEETLKKEENKYAILQYRMENLMEFNPAANLLSEDEVYRTGGQWRSLLDVACRNHLVADAGGFDLHRHRRQYRLRRIFAGDREVFADEPRQAVENFDVQVCYDSADGLADGGGAVARRRAGGAVYGRRRRDAVAHDYGEGRRCGAFLSALGAVEAIRTGGRKGGGDDHFGVCTVLFVAFVRGGNGRQPVRVPQRLPSGDAVAGLRI